MSGTVYTVASGKGGVGKTTTSVNLAVALWQEGKTVGLIDADIGMANLAAVLNIQPEATLHDVLAGRATVDEAIVEAQGGNLLVLPGDRELESFADAEPRRLRDAVDELGDRCDYVIVDTGAGLSYEDVLPLGMAHGVLLVTTPDPAAFGDTRKTMEVADLLGAPIRGLVVTRAVEDTDAPAIAGEIGAELLGSIPEDPAVMASTVAGNPLESHAPDSAAAGAYRDLASTLLAGDEEWLEANPAEPAPAAFEEPESDPVVEASPDVGGDEPDHGSGESGLEAGEAWAAANEDAVGVEEATDIGDLMVEPGEADEPREDRAPTPSGGQPVGESDDAGPADEDGDARSADQPAEPETTPADVDEPAAGDSGSAFESDGVEEDDHEADETEPGAAPAGVDEPAGIDETAGEEADEEVEADRTEAGASRADAPSGRGGYLGGEDADEGEVEDFDGDGEAEESAEPDGVPGQDEEAPDEPSDDEAEAYEGAEEEAGEDEDVEAPDEPEDEGDEEPEDVPESVESDDGDVAAELEGGEEAAEADESEALDEESEESEKRGGIRGWLGRLF